MRERIKPDHIARLGIAANEDLLAANLAQPATHFARIAPDQLRVVADIRDISGFGVVRESAGFEMLFLCDPKIDHGFSGKCSGCSAPDVFPLERLTGNIRRVLKLAIGREVIRPLLRAEGQFIIPTQRGCTHFLPLEIVAGEHACLQIADTRLHARQSSHHCCQKNGFSECNLPEMAHNLASIWQEECGLTPKDVPSSRVSGN